jgi:hypothetical protein
MPVGREELTKARADQLSKRDPVREADGERDGVRAHQARGGGAVLAPVDEDLAEASVVALVGGEVEPFSTDGNGRGVSAAPPWHLPLHARHAIKPSSKPYTNCLYREL